MTFSAYVQSIHDGYQQALGRQLPDLMPLAQSVPFRSQRILILAPHPDDECLMAGFALRAKAEWNAVVGVVSFSFGSEEAKRANRRLELSHALQRLGFVSVEPRVSHDRELSSSEILSAFETFQPDTIIAPHAQDGHSTHIRCAVAARLAAESYAKQRSVTVHFLTTEFWQSMKEPRLVLPLNVAQVSLMGDALCCHQGEILRNPFHLTLPAFLMDQLRRGSEMQVGASGKSLAGSAKIDAVFGQIYGWETLA